jgi:hypothetical protein
MESFSWVLYPSVVQGVSTGNHRQLCHREIIVLTSPVGGFMLSLAS